MTGVTERQSSNRWYEYAGSDNAAISVVSTLGKPFKIVSVRVHFSATPTTSENLTISLDAKAGSAFDVVLQEVDPSISEGDIVWVPDEDQARDVFVAANEISVVYPNTDGNTVGVMINLERLN